MNPDFIKLHSIIVLWGFTAILGKIIDLPALEVVLYRTIIAAVCLALMLRGGAAVSWPDGARLTANGVLIGLHWVLFFLAVKVANVSVCLVAVATTSLWTALLEPLLLPDRRMRGLDLFFGAIVIGAVAFIFQSELRYSDGFLIGIGAAVAAAVFSIINGTFASRFHHRVITLYEMLGAALFCAVSIPLVAHVTPEIAGVDLRPTLMDAFWLFVLAVVCTVYAFSEYVELLKRLSVFTVNFANNLEPIYGMILGALLLKDHHHLGFRFYLGAGIILVAVASYPLLRRRYTVAMPMS